MSFPRCDLDVERL